MRLRYFALIANRPMKPFFSQLSLLGCLCATLCIGWQAGRASERAPAPFGDTNRLAPPLDAVSWPAATNGPLDTMLNPAWVEEEKHGWPHTNFQYIPRPGTNVTPIKLQSAEAVRAPQPSFADGVLIATAVLRQNPGFAGLLSPQEQVALCLRVWQASQRTKP